MSMVYMRQEIENLKKSKVKSTKGYKLARRERI